MNMNSIAIGAPRRLLVAASLIVLAASPAALAQATPDNPTGAMSFPNVRVVAVPTGSRITISADHMKAFLDAESGALAEPSFDQLDELQRARGHHKPEGKARNAVRTLPNGTLVLQAPASMINLSIARIGANGGLEMACTPPDGLASVFHVKAAEVRQ
jgi:hypothetical protein